MIESDEYPLLAPDECRRLAASLGDTPDTVIEIHALQRGLGRAFAIGAPDAFAAALVEAGNLPAEPHGFARDPATLCALLEGVRGWDCVLVDRELAQPLARLVEERIAPCTRLYESMHLALRRPVAPHCHPAVRFLGTADIPLIETAPEELRPDGFVELEDSLTVGAVAGAVIGGRLVSVACVDALTARFGEISVHTLSPWRKQGIAAAAASLVAQELQRRGRNPVWYTGWDNEASLRVAVKLGFSEVSRPVYVIRQNCRRSLPE